MYEMKALRFGSGAPSPFPLFRRLKRRRRSSALSTRAVLSAGRPMGARGNRAVTAPPQTCRRFTRVVATKFFRNCRERFSFSVGGIYMQIKPILKHDIPNGERNFCNSFSILSATEIRAGCLPRKRFDFVSSFGGK